MNIFLVIYLPILILMFFDFKKAFMIYIVMKILLNHNINMINSPGIPLLTLELAMNTAFVLYYYFIEKGKHKINIKFPLKYGFMMVTLSILISTIFSKVGFTNSLSRGIQEIINSYIIVVVFWGTINTNKDIVFLIKGFCIIFIFLGVYGFYEKITGLNPIMEYELSLNSNSENILKWDYDEEGRLGMGRTRSAILHPIGYGVYLSLIISLLGFIYMKYKKMIQIPTIISLFVIGLCILNLLFTNSRSPLIFLIVSILPLVSFKEKYLFFYILLSVLIITPMYTYVLPYIENIISIFTFGSSSAAEIGGSNLDMRADQFVAAFQIFADNAWFGLGIKSMDDYLGFETGILGAESIWLWLIIERGIFGVVSHIILFYFVYKMGKSRIKYFIWSITTGWLVLTTISSTPGINISFFFMVVILIYKIQLNDIILRKFAKQNINYIE